MPTTKPFSDGIMILENYQEGQEQPKLTAAPLEKKPKMKQIFNATEEHINQLALEARFLSKLRPKMLSGLKFTAWIERNKNVTHPQRRDIILSSKVTTSLHIRSQINEDLIPHSKGMADHIAIGKNMKKLEKLKVDLGGDAMSGTRILSSSFTIQHLKHLSTFYFVSSAHAPQAAFKKLFSAIRCLPHLANLHFEFHGYDTDDVVIKLASTLTRLRPLTSLSLNTENLTNKGLERFIFAVGKHKLLSNLGLALKSCSNVNDQHMKEFSCKLSDLKDLSSLYLCLAQTKIKPQGIDHISNGLQTLQKLVNVKFIIPKDFNATMGGSVIALIGTAPTQSLALKTIQPIKYPDFFNKLANTLPKLQYLAALQLNIACTQFRTNMEEALFNLMDAFGALTNLSTLALDFTSCSLFGVGMAYNLGKSLNNLKELNKLRLKFGSKDINFKDNLLESLLPKSTKFPKLQHLYLLFASTEIDDEATTSLAAILNHKSLPQLRELILILTRCKNITEKSHNNLLSICSSLDQLTFLTFRLGGTCFKTDFLLDLLNYLKNHERIDTLDLTVPLSFKDDQMISKFCSSLKVCLTAMKALQKVHIGFVDSKDCLNSCQKSYKERLSTLYRNYELRWLPQLSLDFGLNIDTDQEIIKELFQHRRKWKIPYKSQ